MTGDLWVMSSAEVPGYSHGVPLGRENAAQPYIRERFHFERRGTC